MLYSAEELDEISRFIQERGVTKCPTAIAATTDPTALCDRCGKRFSRDAFRVYPNGRRHTVCIACQNVRKQRLHARRRSLEMSEPRDKVTRKEIFERDGWKCGICGEQINSSLAYPHPASPSVDHKIALSQGGTNLKDNLQACHLRCNLSKWAYAEPLY